MHFGFTDDELLLRDAVRALFERECPPDVVRAAWDAESLDRRVWDALAQMGVPGVLVAEAGGGLGLDELSLVLLLEESGRAALPHPVAPGLPDLHRLAPAAAARGVRALRAAAGVRAVRMALGVRALCVAPHVRAV